MKESPEQPAIACQPKPEQKRIVELPKAERNAVVKRVRGTAADREANECRAEDVRIYRGLDDASGLRRPSCRRRAKTVG